MSLPYMPLYVGDYAADTAHLGAHEHGAYLLLIMNYWQRGKPLPDDERKLAGIARLTREEWAEIRDGLAEFFEVEGGVWRHKRVEREFARATEKVERASRAGKASAAARGQGRARGDDGSGGEGGSGDANGNGRSTDVQQASNEKKRGEEEEKTAPKGAAAARAGGGEAGGGREDGDSEGGGSDAGDVDAGDVDAGGSDAGGSGEDPGTGGSGAGAASLAASSAEVTAEALRAPLLDAAGGVLAPQAALMLPLDALRWIAEGSTPDEILAVVARKCAGRPACSIRSTNWLEPAVAEARARRLAPPDPASKPPPCRDAQLDVQLDTALEHVFGTEGGNE